MKLPCISITKEITHNNKYRKLFAGAIAIATMYVNFPSSKAEFLDQIGEGAKWGLSEGILVSLINHFMSFKNNEMKNVEQNLSEPNFPNIMSMQHILPITLGPIDEEIINRAILYTLIRRTLELLKLPPSYAFLLAVISSSIIFALQHDPDLSDQQYNLAPSPI